MFLFVSAAVCHGSVVESEGGIGIDVERWGRLFQHILHDDILKVYSSALGVACAEAVEDVEVHLSCVFAFAFYTPCLFVYTVFLEGLFGCDVELRCRLCGNGAAQVRQSGTGDELGFPKSVYRLDEVQLP